jgi:hypothetical protein
MWHGQSEQKLHALFESAWRVGPAVLFFDEAEAQADALNEASLPFTLLLAACGSRACEKKRNT